MPKIVRLGDASSHGGVVISAASKWDCEGAKIARIGDLHSCPIPGHGITPIITGSGKWRCEEAGIARHGDVVGCGATLISGATKYDVD